MIEDVASRNAEVVGERRGQILEVAADLIDELKADLRDRGAAAHEQLVTAVRQAQPGKALGAVSEGANRVRDHAALLVGPRAERARVDNGVHGALPAVAT